MERKHDGGGGSDGSRQRDGAIAVVAADRLIPMDRQSAAGAIVVVAADRFLLQSTKLSALYEASARPRRRR